MKPGAASNQILTVNEKQRDGTFPAIKIPRSYVIVRFRKIIEISLTSILFIVFSHNVQAHETNCFSRLKDYLIRHYGETFSEDENVIASKKTYGNQIFTAVEDLTSGTNHSFTLMKQFPQKICVVLTTTPAVSLDALAYDKSGFPTELVSVDQAAPSAAAHEISYTFDSKKNIYVTASCREIRYQGAQRHVASVDCQKVLNY